MICDIITYNGEKELFDIRYGVLYNYVDEFRVIEFDRTFSGKPKSSIFDRRYEKVKHYFVTEDMWSQYMELAKQSPNTQGAEHWKTEFCQKESIKDCLTDLQDDDIIFIGDCDEIWDPDMFSALTLYPCKAKLRVYSYHLDNRSSEEFWGTIVAQYRDIKDKCLNHLRSTDFEKTVYELGWHFTSMGGHDVVKKKLTDSYTEDSYANPHVLNYLKHNIDANKDFLGRQFSYMRDEREWPQYLKDNKLQYKHLLMK